MSLISGEAAPALPLSPAYLHTLKEVGNPDPSRVLAHLCTKCSIIINDHNDNSAYYYCYCSCENKELANLDIVMKFSFGLRKTFPSNYTKRRVEKELRAIVIKCN